MLCRLDGGGIITFEELMTNDLDNFQNMDELGDEIDRDNDTVLFYIGVLIKGPRKSGQGPFVLF